MHESRRRVPRPDRWIRWFVREYPVIQITIGAFGNATFVVGSVMFLFARWETPGIYLFIFGSFGMLLGSAGEVLNRYEQQQVRKGKGVQPIRGRKEEGRGSSR